jgi:putative Holliday junction resolvase
METTPNKETILALDVGERRIGVARCRLDARFPQPLTTLEQPATFMADIAQLIETEKAACLVVGRPRGLQGQETAQTAAVEAFVGRLQPQVDVPIYRVDEAVTSVSAEAELKQRGKPYARGDIDALAATYILEDFIAEHPEAAHV